MLTPRLETAPAEQPVSLDDIKRHVRRALSTDDDAMLQAYIDAAVAHLDGWRGVLGRCMVTQTWIQPFTGWQSGLALPFPDIASVTVRYTDAEDALQTLTEGLDFELGDIEGVPTIWYAPSFSAPDLTINKPAPIEVELTAGYGAAADVPAAVKQALRMLVAHWFLNREAVGETAMAEMPASVTALIAPHRWIAS